LLNVDAALQTYLDAGVAPDQVVMGLPFYGRAWSGVPPIDDGLYQSSTGLPPGTWEAGIYDYHHILDLMVDPVWIHTVHSETMVPWLYNPTEQIFISYDDVESFGHKLDYLAEHDLGGVMFWELSGDTEDHALVDLLHSRLGG
jgi:chitinase